eukprot:TRINITY_DN1825_c0_g1_i1.p1 TRINITY_DN1825_c0_g1~~TRINITY_DN1825_c0_g1_i1.p1  ORF type:complete len:215 (+),score=45.77 TRINITY_DN1825_c0_g1_i1:65-709(+)
MFATLTRFVRSATPIKSSLTSSIRLQGFKQASTPANVTTGNPLLFKRFLFATPAVAMFSFVHAKKEDESTAPIAEKQVDEPNTANAKRGVELPNFSQLPQGVPSSSPFSGFFGPNGQPRVTDLGVGALVGFTTGITLKIFGSTIAMVLGCSFLLIQALCTLGYAKVDWARLEHDVQPLIEERSKSIVEIAKKFMVDNTQFATSFAAGFYMSRMW